MQTSIMRIEINEMAKAFRVNGVTVAKRHLVYFAKDCEGKSEQLFAKFMAVLPFLAEAFNCPEDANETVKYCVFKAKRIAKALELDSNNTVPFMLMALQQAGYEDGAEGIKSLGQELRASGFYDGKAVPFQSRERAANVIPFPGKRTLH